MSAIAEQSDLVRAASGKAPASAAAKPAHLGYIQALRGIAAAAVALSHISKEIRGHIGDDRFHILEFLHSFQFGVDLFFIVSGFVMYHVTANQPSGPKSAERFLKKRLNRIVPMYWISTGVMLLPILLAPHLLNHVSYDIRYIVASFTFVPWPRPEDGVIEPILGLGWTLNFEMLFYLIFATLIALSVRHRVLSIFVTMIAMTVAGYFISAEYPQLWYWTRSCVLEFAFGVAIAALVHRNAARLSPVAGAALIIGGLAIWQVSSYLWLVADPGLNIRGLTWGTAAASIVAGIALTPAISQRFGHARPLKLLGDASYSLYLTHMFVVRISTIALGFLITGMLAPLYAMITLGACVCVAQISYQLLERPFAGQFGAYLKLQALLRGTRSPAR